jgi:hypothetical protein
MSEMKKQMESEKDFLKFLDDKVEVNVKIQILDLWANLRKRAHETKTNPPLPGVMESYDESESWCLFWNNKNHYLNVEINKTGPIYFFERFRKTNQSRGIDISELSEEMMDTIISWRPSKDTEDD